MTPEEILELLDQNYEFKNNIPEDHFIQLNIWIKWFDNSPNVIGSNYEECDINDTCQKWDKKNKIYISVAIPEVIENHNN